MGRHVIRMLSNSYADAANANAQNLSVREIARRLDPGKFHTTLFVSSAPDPRLSDLPHVGFRRFRAHGKAVRFLSEAYAGRYAVNFYVRNEWVDGLYLRLRPLLAPKQVAVYHVVSAMGARVGTPRLFAAQTAGVLRSQIVACNSSHVADTVERHLGVRPPVVRNGVDFERFTPRSFDTPSFRPVVLFAGSLQGWKRPEMVLEAAARVRDADFRLIGSGPLHDELARRADKMPNVALTPAVDQESLAKEMRRADVFLLPSSSEGAPQVLAQAAASGLPAIAFSAYRPEAVVDGRTGFVVGDDEEMIERLRLLVSRPDLRVAMGSEGVQLVHERFDWNRCVGQWGELIEQAVRAARAPGARVD